MEGEGENLKSLPLKELNEYRLWPPLVIGSWRAQHACLLQKSSSRTKLLPVPPLEPPPPPHTHTHLPCSWWKRVYQGGYSGTVGVLVLQWKCSRITSWRSSSSSETQNWNCPPLAFVRILVNTFTKCCSPKDAVVFNYQREFFFFWSYFCSAFFRDCCFLDSGVQS